MNCTIVCRITGTIALSLLAGCSSLPGKDGSTTEKEMEIAAQMKQKGDLEGAAAVYRKLIVSSDKPVAAELELAPIDRKLGRYDEAVDVMKAAQKKQPENPAVLSQLAYALLDTGKTEDAVGIFDQLIALKPDYALAYNGKGVAFDRAGNHLAAQDLYLKALKLSPGSASIQNNMAMSFLLNHQLDQAIALLEQLSKDNGNNKTIRQNLALAYALKGDKQKAQGINLQDLSPEEAEDNAMFYERIVRQYRKSQKQIKDAHVGFDETPQDKKETATPEIPSPQNSATPSVNKAKKEEKSGKDDDNQDEASPDDKTESDDVAKKPVK